MSEALLELVHSALLMTYSLTKSWLKARQQGTWVFDEEDWVLAWKTPGVGIKSMWKNQSKGSSVGLGLHQDKGSGKERVGMELSHLDFD